MFTTASWTRVYETAARGAEASVFHALPSANPRQATATARTMKPAASTMAAKVSPLSYPAIIAILFLHLHGRLLYGNLFLHVCIFDILDLDLPR